MDVRNKLARPAKRTPASTHAPYHPPVSVNPSDERWGARTSLASFTSLTATSSFAFVPPSPRRRCLTNECLPRRSCCPSASCGLWYNRLLVQYAACLGGDQRRRRSISKIVPTSPPPSTLHLLLKMYMKTTLGVYPPAYVTIQDPDRQTGNTSRDYHMRGAHA